MSHERGTTGDSPFKSTETQKAKTVFCLRLAPSTRRNRPRARPFARKIRPPRDALRQE